jgi:hypothetical protein
MQTSSSASWQRKKGLGLDPGEGRLRSDSTRRAATTTAHALARQEFPRWLLQYNKKPCRNFTNKHTVVRFCRIRRLVIACNHRSVCSCRFVATREEGCLASGTHDGFPSLLFAGVKTWRLRRTRARSFTEELGGKLTSTGRHAMGLIGPWAGPTQTRVSFFLPDEVISSGSERTQLLLRTWHGYPNQSQKKQLSHHFVCVMRSKIMC